MGIRLRSLENEKAPEVLKAVVDHGQRDSLERVVQGKLGIGAVIRVITVGKIALTKELVGLLLNFKDREVREYGIKLAGQLDGIRSCEVPVKAKKLRI